jgi:hypothetical protein
VQARVRAAIEWEAVCMESLGMAGQGDLKFGAIGRPRGNRERYASFWTEQLPESGTDGGQKYKLKSSAF